MKKNDCKCPVYLCELPPPFGGVTVKNELIIQSVIKNNMKIEVLDLYECKRSRKNGIIVLVKILRAFIEKRKIVYGFGSYKRLEVALFIQKVLGGDKSLKRSINIVMGGLFQDYIFNRKSLIRLLQKLDSQWVETDGMKLKMEQLGLQNVLVFPNPKSEIGACEPRLNYSQPLKLVFFSQISEEKGVKDIMALVQLLEQTSIKYHLDFYGHIVPSIESEFKDFIEEQKNVSYQGVFDSIKSSVYAKLNEYDLLLFPSRWIGEGVPGVIVESKMAGIAIIASNHAYNSELVNVNNREGFLVYNDYPQEMLSIIQQCNSDRMLLQQVKENSFLSRKRYSLEEFKHLITRIGN